MGVVQRADCASPSVNVYFHFHFHFRVCINIYIIYHSILHPLTCYYLTRLFLSPVDISGKCPCSLRNARAFYFSHPTLNIQAPVTILLSCWPTLSLSSLSPRKCWKPWTNRSETRRRLASCLCMCQPKKDSWRKKKHPQGQKRRTRGLTLL